MTNKQGFAIPKPQEIPEVLYHFTGPANVPSILQSGLLPHRDVLGNPPFVWLNVEPRYPGGAHLLTITTKGLDPGKFRTFPDQPDNPWLYKGTIPPRNIQARALRTRR